MKTSITFRHMDGTDSLKTYVTEKLTKIDKFVVAPVEAHVVLFVEKNDHIADITIHEKDLTAKGMERSADMYSSIDGAVEKVEKTLRRRKDRIKSIHKGQIG